MKTNTSNSTGVGFLTLLGLMFIGLKLTGHIDWSWWFVLMPFYLPAVLIMTFVIVVVALGHRTTRRFRL